MGPDISVADPQPEGIPAQLTVHRTSARDMQERELYVSVDGGRNHILRFGDSITVPIAPGHHRIRVHNTLSRRAAEFDAAAGDHIRFSASNVRGKGFELLAVFFGIAPMHTLLERDEPPSAPTESDGERLRITG